MKKPFLVLAAVATAAFVFITGCETEKLSDTQLSISPSSATVAPGKSVALTASGGWDYTWSKPAHGTLSAYNGKKVTYTANELSSTNGTELTDIVEVHSASNHTATATITIKGE